MSQGLLELDASTRQWMEKLFLSNFSYLNTSVHLEPIRENKMQQTDYSE